MIKGTWPMHLRGDEEYNRIIQKIAEEIWMNDDNETDDYHIRIFVNYFCCNNGIKGDFKRVADGVIERIKGYENGTIEL